MVPAERQTAVSIPMRTKIFRMLPMVRTPLPHRPTISRGRKPRRKACPVKHSSPKARAHSKDAPVTMHRASPPRNSDMTTAFMDMIPFHARPGLSNAFPPEKPCIAGRLPPVCTTWTISGKSRLPALPYDEKPGPSYKEAGLIFFFPSAGSLSQRRNLGASSPLP